MITNAQAEMKLLDKDIKLSADQIAQAVWIAAHSNKMHHYVGADAKMIKALKWLLPEVIFAGILKASFFKEAIAKN